LHNIDGKRENKRLYELKPSTKLLRSRKNVEKLNGEREKQARAAAAYLR
jgi:hypothetical protein